MNRRESGVKQGGTSTFKDHFIAFVASAKKNKGPRDPKPQPIKEEKKFDSETGAAPNRKLSVSFAITKGISSLTVLF